MNKLRGLIFDFDRTLFHTGELAENTLQTICTKLELPCPIKDFKKLSGIPHLKKLEILFPGNKQIIQEWNNIYYSKFFKEIRPYKGIIKELQNLQKSYKIYIFSTREQEIIQKVLNQCSIKELFVEIAGKNEKQPDKPSQNHLLHSLNKHDIDPSETIMIGDSEVDRQTSKNAGTYFGFAKWGSKHPEKIQSYDIIFEKPEDLWRLRK